MHGLHLQCCASNRRSRTTWGLLYPQNEALVGMHRKCCHGCDTLIHEHCMSWHLVLRKESLLPLSSEAVFTFIRMFWLKQNQKTKKTPSCPSSPFVYPHFYSIQAFLSTRVQRSEKASVFCFHFLCLLKINMLRSCLLVSLSSPKWHVAIVKSALTTATAQFARHREQTWWRTDFLSIEQNRFSPSDGQSEGSSTPRSHREAGSCLQPASLSGLSSGDSQQTLLFRKPEKPTLQGTAQMGHLSRWVNLINIFLALEILGI